MEQVLKPENLVIIRALTLEENVEWLSWRCKQFNAALSKALKELETEVESGKARQQAVYELKSRVFPGTSFLLGMLHGVSLSLVSSTKRQASLLTKIKGLYKKFTFRTSRPKDRGTQGIG